MTADHWCVAFAGEAELGTSAAGLLSEGLARGEQVGYFGWGGADVLRGRLHGLGVADEIVERGVARVASLDEHFRRDEPPEPDRLVGFWSDATQAALDAGFSAL